MSQQVSEEQIRKWIEIAEKAQAASPDYKWGYDLNGYIRRIHPDDEEWGLTVCKLVGAHVHEIGEHIARFDPSTVLLLLKEIQGLREHAKAQQLELEGLRYQRMFSDTHVGED